MLFSDVQIYKYIRSPQSSSCFFHFLVYFVSTHRSEPACGRCAMTTSPLSCGPQSQSQALGGPELSQMPWFQTLPLSLSLSLHLTRTRAPSAPIIRCSPGDLSYASGTWEGSHIVTTHHTHNPTTSTIAG